LYSIRIKSDLQKKGKGKIKEILERKIIVNQKWPKPSWCWPNLDWPTASSTGPEIVGGLDDPRP
jgi:hypothetical protein